MKPKFREVLEMAITEGVQYGYRRAHKHVENPSEGAIIDSICGNVMDCIYEWFEFEDQHVSN
jgi:hypothetical protein